MDDREFIRKVKVLIDKFVSEWIYLNGEYEKEDIVRVITKQEEAEQDRDRREMDGDTKTYDNPFPTDEALDFDVNVRERV